MNFERMTKKEGDDKPPKGKAKTQFFLESQTLHTSKIEKIRYHRI